MRREDRIFDGNGTQYIDITDIPLRDFVKRVYNMSQPVEMGFLHYEPGDMTDDEADAIINRNTDLLVAVHMDYVRGRQCKMFVFQRHPHEDRPFLVKNPHVKRYIHARWMDHTDEQLDMLLRNWEED